jgi:galactoside O-acetyltransferase
MENIFFDISKLKKVGKNSIIGKTVRIRRPELVEIGRNTIIDDFAYISSQLKIGDFTHISAGCKIIGGAKAIVEIGNFVNIGPNCNIVGGQNDYRGGGLVGPPIPEGYGGEADIEPIKLEDHVLLGCNVVILPGVYLPEGVSVGAFSLLKKMKYKPWTLYAGIPAKELGPRDGTLIKKQAEKIIEDAKRGIL